MSSFIFALNAVLPIIITTVIGYILKKINLITDQFASMANKLVFKVFLPAMLFVNVCKIDIGKSVSLWYILYVVIAVVVIFAIGIPIVMLITPTNKNRGVILQGLFRSNYALIGIPLAQSLFGDEGAVYATLLSAIVIPLFNILAIISLSIFDDNRKEFSFSSVVIDILKNPLIISVFVGIIYLLLKIILIKNEIGFSIFDTPLYPVLGYLSNSATPIALLMLGVQFKFSQIKEYRMEIIFGAISRVVIVPVVCIGIALLFFADTFNGAHFATFVAAFATPIAVSSVPMSQEMNGNAHLAGQLVIWTTLLSSFTVFLFTFILKILDVF